MSNSPSDSPISETKSRVCEIGTASTQNQEKKEVVKCFFLPAEIVQIPVWGHTAGVGVQASDRLETAIFIFGLNNVFIHIDPCSLCHMVSVC